MTTPVPLVASDWNWRREGWMVLLLSVMVMGGYFCRASAADMVGEEPRRAQVAVEMIESGDWVVPHDQGQPFFSRPPLQNWLIAVCYLISGERDAFGARVPSLLATWLMVLVIYGYGRSFMTRTGALAAALAFATMGEVLQAGRTAETEAVFTLMVGGSLLVWHWGMTRGWPDVLAWSLGYALVALGMLAKSLQAPYYFLVSVTAFLILTRQWRRLFSLSHLAGIAVGAAVLAVWVIPYAARFGIPGVRHIWMSDLGPRMFDWEGFLTHLVEFPLELIGCTLPWSPLLLAFCRREFRSTIGAARPQVLFMALVLALGVPTCWLPPQGATRYILPLYPCLAVLIGFVVQRCGEAAADSALGVMWRRCLLAYAGLMLVVAAAVPALGLFRGSPRIAGWAEPPLTGAAFGALFLAAAWLTRKLALAPALAWRTGAAVVVIAGFMFVFYTGPIVNARVRRGNDVAAQVAQLKAELPPDVQFVSLGPAHAEFRFFARRPVKLLPLSEQGARAVPQGAYFCFSATDTFTPPIPFAWQHVKTIPIDRTRRDPPEDMLVIGRRMQ